MKPVRKNNVVLVFLSFIIVFFGCNKEKITEETLIKVYVENVVIEETYSTNSDSLLIRRNAVFSKYNMTESDFQNELRKYANDKTKWESFFKKANDYLNDLKKSNTIN